MINYSRQSIDNDDIEAVVQALKSDFITGGKRVEEFEEALCRYVGTKYAVAMNSATSSLHVAYLCAELKKDDEIITTPLTFMATSNAALMVGAKPVFCDVKSDANIDENKIESLISPKTKAIVPVDFGGKPVEIQKIKSICKKHNLLLIEDSCHALGSEFNGKKVGIDADIAIFSFHAIKPITTCGEGGALVTNSKEIYKRAKLLRSHAIEKKRVWNSDAFELGYNYRMSDISASLGISQLKKLDRFIEKREQIAKFYDKTFKGNPYFYTQKLPAHIKSSYHLYPIFLDRSLWCAKEEIYEELHKRGIGVQVHYKPVYQFSLYKNLFKEQKLHNAEEVYKSELSIPCHQEMSLEDAKFVAINLMDVLKKQNHCRK